MNTFHNPYAFVPADRREVRARHKPRGDLADGPPAPLGRLHPDRWTGRLRVSLTAESPLLLTAVTRIDKVDTKDHPVRETRRDARRPDRADLLATTVKGMLRSVFEASTNSRFGVFADHGRLTQRGHAFPATPEELAEEQNVLPVDAPDRASVADRLFGWATTRSARRGRVRIGVPVLRPDTGIQSIAGDDGVPLGVLSSPKPSYELFYAGTPDGQPARLGKGFVKGGGLRGRKFYPAHPEDSRRWDAGRQQPWMRPDQKRDDQNAGVLDWVPPGATFDIDIQVEDLNEIELGALLWLLDPRRKHRLGLGRPFGFGTVCFAQQWDHSELRNGAAWRSHYRLEPHDRLASDELADHAIRFVDSFEQAVEDLYGKRRPRFLAALERALEGFPDDSTPVRYPPDPKNPGSYENSYKWFVANQNKGPRTALGDLAEGWKPLPVRPEDAKQSRSDGRPRGRDRRNGGNSGQRRRRDNRGS